MVSRCYLLLHTLHTPYDDNDLVLSENVTEYSERLG